MAFSESESKVLLSVKGVGPTVLKRFEESSTVEWLDIDSMSLEIAALDCGFSMEIIRVEDDGNYLAVLRKLNYRNVLKSDAQHLAFPARGWF